MKNILITSTNKGFGATTALATTARAPKNERAVPYSRLTRTTLSAIVVLFTALPGCFSRPVLSPEGSNVQLMKGDPPSGCKDLGPTTGTSMRSAGSQELPADELEYAKVSLRNKAAQMGGNYVRMDAGSTDGTTLSGQVYKCSPR